MHDRFLNNTSPSAQEMKPGGDFAEAGLSFPPTAPNASAGTSARFHCECLDKLAEYAAAPPAVSEPNCCGQLSVWFDASARRGRIEAAFATSDLGHRADLVQKYGITPTCTCSRALIESVADASMTGVLVQSFLAGPVQEAPRILKKLVQENQRNFAAARISKRQYVQTRRGSPVLDMLSHLVAAGDAKKA